MHGRDKVNGINEVVKPGNDGGSIIFKANLLVVNKPIEPYQDPTLKPQPDYLLLDNYFTEPHDPTLKPLSTPPNDPLTEKDRWNYLSRCFENGRFLGGVAEMPMDNHFAQTHESSNTTDANEIKEDQQVDYVVDNAGGMIIGLIINRLLKNRYKKNQWRNPMYRNFKTLASFGASVGMLFGYLLPLPEKAQKFFAAIIGNAASLFFGLFAIPYWLLGQKENQINKKDKNIYTRTGDEGWSKYAKTFLVYGTALGQVGGAIYYHFRQNLNLVTSMVIGGAIGGVTSFLVGIVMVPAINYFCSKVLTADGKNKEEFRNNYIRSGITLGVAVGSVIGFVFGSLLFPGLGSFAGMAIGAGIGSLMGGVTLGMNGYKITNYVEKNWKSGGDSDNSWDYAARNMSLACGFLGTVVGCFLPVPGGILIGAALGAAIAGVIGWVAGLEIVYRARKTEPDEKNKATADTLPWTQRIASGSNACAIIGAVIGLVVGLLGGPIGIIAGVVLGGAIGGVIGGIIGALYDKQARRLIRETMVGKKDPQIQTPVTTTIRPIVLPAPAPIRRNSLSNIATADVKPEEKSRPRSHSVDVQQLRIHENYFSLFPSSKKHKPRQHSYPDFNLTRERAGAVVSRI